MKRLTCVVSILGIVLLLSAGVRATPSSATSTVHDGCTATDDPVPVECPFCGGDPMLHVKRMNAITVTSSRIAYQLLDASLF